MYAPNRMRAFTCMPPNGLASFRRMLPSCANLSNRSPSTIDTNQDGIRSTAFHGEIGVPSSTINALVLSHLDIAFLFLRMRVAN